MKIKEILRLSEQGCSQRQVASSVKCAKSTVGEVQRRSRENGLDYAEAACMTNEQIKQRLYPDSGRDLKPDPDWKVIHERLTGKGRLNLKYVYTEEYEPNNPEGLSYSQFCKRYRAWRDETGKNVIMVRNREPGKELFVDFMGDTLPCVIDTDTGELMEAHFFVSTLGDSNYPYVEAFPDEKHESWLAAHVHAFEWYGGLPLIVVPDNCKTATTKYNYYDPDLNQSYKDLATHYDVAVIPARRLRPRDKGACEDAVGWMETWLVEWLRGRQFLSFEELNREVRKRVKHLVTVPFQERRGSRASVFEALDKPALRPLTQTRYEYADYVVRSVPNSYTVEYDGFYYSVPYKLYKQKVTMRITATMIEIMNDNRERVALHERRRSGSRYVMKPEHMPANHRHQHEFNARTGDDYRQWAENIGKNTFSLIDALLNAQSIEQTAYRSCMGVLQMSKKHGNSALEQACGQAMNAGSPTYNAVKKLIGKPVPKKAVALQEHENLRDPAEFA